MSMPNFIWHGQGSIKVFLLVFYCMSFSCVQLWPYGWQPTRNPCPPDSPGKNTGVGWHALLQGIFLTQGSNTPFLMCPALASGFFTTSASATNHHKLSNLRSTLIIFQLVYVRNLGMAEWTFWSGFPKISVKELAGLNPPLKGQLKKNLISSFLLAEFIFLYLYGRGYGLDFVCLAGSRLDVLQLFCCCCC